MQHYMKLSVAARSARMSRKRMRELMDDGNVKGDISPKRKNYRPLAFSVYHDAMGYPEEIALKLAFGPDGVPEIADVQNRNREPRSVSRLVMKSSKKVHS